MRQIFSSRFSDLRRIASVFCPAASLMHGAWTQNTSSPSVSRKCTQLFSRTGVTSVIWYNIAYSSLTASGL